MTCILPDGSITETAKKVLIASKELITAEKIGEIADLQLFKVRSRIRELLEAGFIELKDEKYIITEEGRKKI